MAPDCNAPPPRPPALSFGPDRSDPDTDGAYTLKWTRPAGAVGPDLLQEATDLSVLISDDAEAGLGNWRVSTEGAGAFAWETSTAKKSGGESAFWARAVEGATNAASILEFEEPITIPAGGQTSLTFWDWFVTESDDVLYVEVHDGAKWVPVRSTSRAILASDQAVAFQSEPLSKNSIYLSRFRGGTIRLRFRYTVGPENKAAMTPTFGWFVDDISIDTADWRDLATASQTSYRRTGLADGTYHYRVRTACPFGSAVTLPGPWSNVVTARVERLRQPDLRVADIVASNNQARGGDKVTLTATVANLGTADVGPSDTEFLLDGTTLLGLLDTPPIPAGGAVTVSVQWDTRSVSGEHAIRVRVDKTQSVVELDETNNVATRTVVVQGNKVKNGSFQQ